VVLGFRNFDVTTRVCLDSLLPWLDDPEIEVLVIDNGSPDDSADKTAAWCIAHPRVKCLLSSSNRGFSGGMNWGVSQASGQWLLLVNTDTVFPISTLDALKRVLRRAPADVAMLGPVTNAAGNGQRLWKPGTTHAEWLKIGQWINENPTHQLMPTYRCDFFCIAIRRHAWARLGGLDLDFGLGYYEDFDFSLRLAQYGYRQMITEDVFILHLGSATFKASAAARALINRNKKLLKSKHAHARFEHTRLGNLAVLREYERLLFTEDWTQNLRARTVLRIDALKGDEPRSLIKRWLWNRKIGALRTVFYQLLINEPGGI
jgi:GT2 family glycosyltransferase